MSSVTEYPFRLFVCLLIACIMTWLAPVATAQYIYSDKYLISFRQVSSSAQSFVMGEDYTVRIGWQVEGRSPDRDFVMRYRLMDPYGRRVVASAAERGMVGLKGHRSVGGCRASIYNAMPMGGVETLREFMVDFQRSGG